jgi:hypothetical protein
LRSSLRHAGEPHPFDDALALREIDGVVALRGGAEAFDRELELFELAIHLNGIWINVTWARIRISIHWIFLHLSSVDSKATVTPFLQSECRLLTQVQLQRPVHSARRHVPITGGRGQRVSELS